MLKIISNTTGWKCLFASFQSLRDEAALKFVPELGIVSKTIDVSSHEFSDMIWEKKNFIEFQVDKEKKIAFNVEQMNKIFKRFDKNDIVVVELIDNQLSIKKQDSNKEFKSGLVDDVNSGYKESPSRIGEQYEIKLNIDQLEEMINDSEVFKANKAWLISIDGKLTYKGQGDYGEGEANGVLMDDFKGDISNTAFRFEYLKPFLADVKPYVNKEITVGIFPQKPLHLKLTVENVGTMNYFLAPQTNKD